MIYHGEDLRGNLGVYSNIPSLVNIKDRMTNKSLEEIILNGKGIMPSFQIFQMMKSTQLLII